VRQKPVKINRLATICHLPETDFHRLTVRNNDAGRVAAGGPFGAGGVARITRQSQQVSYEVNRLATITTPLVDQPAEWFYSVLPEGTTVGGGWLPSEYGGVNGLATTATPPMHRLCRRI
jgi:hypothetical protein